MFGLFKSKEQKFEEKKQKFFADAAVKAAPMVAAHPDFKRFVSDALDAMGEEGQTQVLFMLSYTYCENVFEYSQKHGSMPDKGTSWKMIGDAIRDEENRFYKIAGDVINSN